MSKIEKTPEQLEVECKLTATSKTLCNGLCSNTLFGIHMIKKSLSVRKAKELQDIFDIIIDSAESMRDEALNQCQKRFR